RTPPRGRGMPTAGWHSRVTALLPGHATTTNLLICQGWKESIGLKFRNNMPKIKTESCRSAQRTDRSADRPNSTKRRNWLGADDSDIA
ncbi:MAG TPA: hypothetical protein VJQ82_09730, partial [Terriglobales bacterium]|nr:hypothetical protein [Terriglobales bacterium]